MKPMKFESIEGDDELVIISKSIYRIMDVKNIPYGDTREEGKVYEYSYDVILNGVFMRYDEEGLDVMVEDMKFVGYE